MSEDLRARIQANKARIRDLKEQQRNTDNPETRKELAKSIQALYIDIRDCKTKIAYQNCIEREFGSILLDD